MLPVSLVSNLTVLHTSLDRQNAMILIVLMKELVTSHHQTHTLLSINQLRSVAQAGVWELALGHFWLRLVSTLQLQALITMKKRTPMDPSTPCTLNFSKLATSEPRSGTPKVSQDQVLISPIFQRPLSAMEVSLSDHYSIKEMTTVAPAQVHTGQVLPQK